ncbi:hypothetical protein BJV77DRAFT_254172 [Russula vinacea]|nr:hypothetical protein BJV77DRAFT_254172 [Russula vinacea]
MSTYQVPCPSWQVMIPQPAFFFFFEDMFHYFLPSAPSHVLYKHFHKLHHKYSSPFGPAAEYAHLLKSGSSNRNDFWATALLLVQAKICPTLCNL